MMIAQIEAGGKALESFQGQFGPYAFGVVAAISIMVTAAVLWARMIAPRVQEISQMRVKGAEEFTKATANIAATAQAQSQQQADIRFAAAIQAEQTKQLGALVDKLVKNQ